MKKKITIVICFILFVIFTIINCYNFSNIENENFPYLSNKEQLKGVFYTNIELFEKVIECVNEHEFLKNVNFQYNSNFGIEQVTDVYGENELSYYIWELVTKCKMTNFHGGKMYNHLTIYQYAPFVSSDIKIGVKYNFKTLEWEYYYEHMHNDCRHKHPILYRVYDLFYNHGAGKPIMKSHTRNA